MKKVTALLVFLISSLSITGISFIDGKIWDIAFMIVGMITYIIVGGLFTIGILNKNGAGKTAYTFVFFLLLVIGYKIYKYLKKLKIWILSWPIFVKILIPSLITLAIVGLIIFIVIKRKKSNSIVT